MSNAAHETQKIQADAARIASLRMELIEELNGLGPIEEAEELAECLDCPKPVRFAGADFCRDCYNAREFDKMFEGARPSVARQLGVR